jgi:hypothetical protein
MRIDEQDFDELRDLINEALQANWECYNSTNDNPNPAKEREWCRKSEEKLWEKFYIMRDSVKSTLLHDNIKERNNK